jgi:hypothetical protein
MAANNKKTPGQYTVQKGDTLSGIAKANNTSLAEIRKNNPKFASDSKYKNGNMIWSGTTVNLGPGGGRGAGISPAGNRPRGAAAGMKSKNTLLGKIGSVAGAIQGGIIGAAVPGIPMLGAAKKGSELGNKLGNAVSPMISKKQFGKVAGVAGAVGLGALGGAAIGARTMSPVGVAGGAAIGAGRAIAKTGAGKVAGTVAGGMAKGAVKGGLKAGPLGVGAGAAIGGAKAGANIMKAAPKAGAATGAVGKSFKGAQNTPFKAGTPAKIQNMPLKPGTPANIVPLNAAKMKKNTGAMEAI